MVAVDAGGGYRRSRIENKVRFRLFFSPLVPPVARPAFLTDAPFNAVSRTTHVNN